MIYLTGAGNGKWVAQALATADGTLGLMLTPKYGRRSGFLPQYPAWAADTGIYGDPRFDLARYLVWLESLSPYRDKCLFATAPDVVGDAIATLERSKWVLPELRLMNYPAALVAQDGLEILRVPWEHLDCLFIGGTTEWKLSEAAWQLAAEAKRRGKHVHLGRTNSWIRLKAAAVSGFNSADGTMVAFGPDKRWRQLVGWLSKLRWQPPLGEAVL